MPQVKIDKGVSMLKKLIPLALVLAVNAMQAQTTIEEALSPAWWCRCKNSCWVLAAPLPAHQPKDAQEAEKLCPAVCGLYGGYNNEEVPLSIASLSDFWTMGNCECGKACGG